jgi:hypothetical protein
MLVVALRWCIEHERAPTRIALPIAPTDGSQSLWLLASSPVAIPAKIIKRHSC